MSKLLAAKGIAVGAASCVVAGFGFTGMAFADSSISDTGPGSINVISSDGGNGNWSSCYVSNHNNVSDWNSSSQWANSGSVRESGNTWAGSAMSGSATNDNWTNTTVDIANGDGCSVTGSGSGGSGQTATISDTGPDSTNIIKDGGSGDGSGGSSQSSVSNQN
jgi:hypothetical protein